MNEPASLMTTWERHEAGLPARDRGERDRYREYEACVTVIDPRLTRDNGPLQVLSSPKPGRSAA